MSKSRAYYTSTIVVKIGTDIEAIIDIKQTILPISKNDNIDVLIEKLGFPDKKKEISVKWPDTQIINGIYYDTTRNVENFYATHYFYKKYPCLCISFVNGSFRLGEFKIVSNLVRNFVPEKSHKSIMLR